MGLGSWNSARLVPPLAGCAATSGTGTVCRPRRVAAVLPIVQDKPTEISVTIRRRFCLSSKQAHPKRLELSVRITVLGIKGPLARVRRRFCLPYTLVAYVRGCQFMAFCKLETYTAKARRPAGVAWIHVRGLEFRNSLVMAR